MKKRFRILNFLEKKMSIPFVKKKMHKKFSGRTMLEMLCVLFIAALISIAAVKMWDYFEDRTLANNLLEDMINARNKAATHKIKAGFTFDRWTNILDATETRSSYGFQAKRFVNEGTVSYVVRPVRDGFPYRFTKELCKHMLRMKSEKFSIYQASSFERGDFVEVESCDVLNDLIFAFSPVTGKVFVPNQENDAQSQYSISCENDADCKVFGFGYICASGICSYSGYCSSNAGCDCAVCNNSSCGETDTKHCCNGVYCAHPCSGDNCCKNGYCTCNYHSECVATYGSGYGCINNVCTPLKCSSNDDCLQIGENYLCSHGTCISGSCSDGGGDSYCIDNFGIQYVCKDGVCTKVACGNTDECVQIMGEGYECLDGTCQSRGCSHNEDCLKFGVGYLCSTNHICENAKCFETGSSFCSKFGNKYICDAGICKNADCENDAICRATFGDGWICLSNTCRDARCSTLSDCTSRFGADWTCFNGKCESLVCSSGSDCLKFGSNQICDTNEKCKECPSIEYCSQPYARNNTCSCKTCEPGYFVNNNKCDKCPSVTGCRTSSSYDSNCGCTDCSNGYELTAGKCCSKVDNCTSYDPETCKCTLCSSGLPSESGSKCCGIKQNCLVYADGNCDCKVCEAGYRPVGGGCEPCTPTNDSRVGNCSRYYGNSVEEIAANVCKCETCESGSSGTYVVNPAGYTSNNLGSQCCRQIENCSVYNGACECVTCDANYRPTPIPQVGQEQNKCCYKIEGCQDHGLHPSNPYQCVCTQCETGYTQAEWTLCCENRSHCATYNYYSSYLYPNTDVKAGICACTSCNDGYKVTATGDCRSCSDKEYCVLYNNDCTCNTCQAGHELKDGNCCDFVAGCTSFTDSCICETCSDDYVHKVLPGDATCCLKKDNCTEYSNNCECTTCENQYKISGGNCVPCAYLAGCDIYSQSDCSCSECEENYDPSNGRCCPKVQNCASYDADCNCAECNDGYTKSGGKCCANVLNCAPGGYNESCACTTCNDNYTPMDGKCCIAVEGCTTYNSSCVCTDCDSEHTLSGGKCCPDIDKCTAYNSSCGCRTCENGYTLKDGTCQSTCSSNDDCDEGEFCNYSTGSNNLGSSGGCSTTEDYGLMEKTLSDGTRWIRSEKEMTWWGAKSFCETQQTSDGVPYNLASRASLGCGNAQYARYCTDSGSSAFPGKSGSRLYKLQTESPAWTEGSHWQEYRTDKAGYAYTVRFSNGFIADATATNYSDSNTHGYALCYACPAITSCTGYDADCDCTSCSGSLIPVNTGSKCCTGVDHCASSGYGSDCACQTCDENYTLSDGKCCSTVENCNTYTSGCACQACKSGYKRVSGQKCCLKLTNCSTYDEATCACTGCDNGYKLEGGNCTNCPSISNCSTYDPMTCACTACNNGYKFNNGSCDEKCPIIENCDTYDQSTCACMTCQEGLSPDIEKAQCCSNINQCSYYDNRCECVGCSTAAGYLPNPSTGHCDLSCNVTGCDAYEWGCLCNRCRSDYDLNTKAFYYGGNDRYTHQCCPKIEGCAEYDEFCNCTACKDGYTAGETLYYDGRYEWAYVSECYIASVPCADEDCNTCPSGYVPSNSEGTCCRVIPGCSGYGDGCKCTECNGSVYGSGYSVSGYGWSYLHNGSCVASCPTGYTPYTYEDYHICKMENCVDYSPINGTCSTCAPGYSGTECEPCEVEHCTGYQSQCSCNACEEGYVASNGVCDAGCTSNSDCEEDEFCLYITSTTSDAGTGRCATFTEYTAQTITATADNVSKRWTRSSKGMNWWSAQNWCERLNLSTVSRSDFDCSSITINGTLCESNMLTAIKNAGWSSGYGWLEAHATTPTVSYSVGFSTSKIHNHGSYQRTSTSPRAFCQCPAVDGCVAYGTDCACTACDTENYTLSRGICLKKVCSQNPECAPTTFCAFENPTSASNSGTGTCRFVDDFVEEGRKTVGRTTYVRTSSTMSWWTALNYCPAKGMTVPSREALGCKGIDDKGCNSTIVNALYDDGWNNGNKAWLSDVKNDSYAYVWMPYNNGKYNGMVSSFKNADSDSRYSRYGFCMFKEGCPLVPNCSDYDDACACSGCAEGFELEDGVCVQQTICPEIPKCSTYDRNTCECTGCISTSLTLLNGECCVAVGGECTQNADCCNRSENFCAFENPIANNNAGTGECRPISEFRERGRKIVDGIEFLRSSTRMSWWTAGNWCEAKGMQQTKRSDLSSDTLTALNNAGWGAPTADGDKSWLEADSAKQAWVWLPSEKGKNVNGMSKNDKNINGTVANPTTTARYGMCTGSASCTPPENCSVWDENCTCTLCANKYTLAANGTCTECPDVDNCSTYDATCACTLCVSTHLLVDDTCIQKCSQNSECGTDSGNFCAFPNPKGNSDKGQGLCLPISTYETEEQTPTVNGITTRWKRTATKVSSWWTGESWCAAHHMKMPTMADFKCDQPGVTGTGRHCCMNSENNCYPAIEGSILKALQLGGWGDQTGSAKAIWLGEQAASNGNMYNMQIKYSGLGWTSYKHSSGFYAICTCQEIEDCSYYNEDCTCSGCAPGYRMDGSQCKKECNTNLDCESTEFCSYHIEGSGECGPNITTRVGVCELLSNHLGDSKTIDGKKWTKSRENMRFWSAQNWCERQKGTSNIPMTLTDRASLGCASCGTQPDDSGRYCTAEGCGSSGGSAYTGSVLLALQSAGWTSEYSWTSDTSSTNRYCYPYYFAYSNSDFIAIDASNHIATALCKSCTTSITGCLAYNADCTCKTCNEAGHFVSDGAGGCACGTGYNLYKSKCYPECQSNDQCEMTEFCALDGSTSGLCNGTPHDVGRCLPLANYGGSSIVVDGKIWTRSNDIMQWWSAENWCERQKGTDNVSMTLPTRADMGCGDPCGTSGHYYCSVEGCEDNTNEARYAYEGSMLRKLQEAGWVNTDNNKANYFLSIGDGRTTCYPRMVSMFSVSIWDIRWDHSYRALCKSCTAIPNCSVYNSDCTCKTCDAEGHWVNDPSTGGCKCHPDYSEYQGACYMSCAQENESCTENTDCCSGNFCAFDSPVSATGNKGSGKCKPISAYPASELYVNVNSQKTAWIRSTTPASSWWTAENWCLAQGYDIATRESVGCSTVSAGWCTDGGLGWGKKGTVLRALQVGGWTEDSYNYLESSSDPYMWRLDMVIGPDKDSSYITTGYKSDAYLPICYKTYQGTLNKANCTTYNTSGECVGCAAGYQLSGTGCVACPGVAHCANATSYDGACGCAVCASGYTAVNGVCYPACSTNANCTDATTYCAFQSAVNSSNKGSGACMPMGTAYAKTTTVNGVTQGWVKGAIELNWCGAETWCARRGAQPATRSDLGCGGTCGSDRNHQYCTAVGCAFDSGNGYAGSVLNAFQTTEPAWPAGWFWLENATGTDAYTVCFSASPIGKWRRAFPNMSASPVGALCKCPIIEGCAQYDTNCSCTDCATGQVLYNGVCRKECESNNDCTETSTFCSFQEATDCTNGNPNVQKGACVPLSDFGGASKTLTDGESATYWSYTTSTPGSKQINWWTAKNWCEAQSRRMVGTEDIGCTSYSCDANSPAVLLRSASPAWTIKYSFWLTDSAGSVCTNKYFLSNNDSSGVYVNTGYSNKHYDGSTAISTDSVRYALCICPPVEHCTQYNSGNCECSACSTGFTTNSDGTACVCDTANNYEPDGNGGCVLSKNCTTNDNCDATEFCAFESPSSCSNKGNGKCKLMADFGTGAGNDVKIVNNKRFVRSSPASTSVMMTRWSAENWCSRKGMELANRASLGCGNVSAGSACTSPSSALSLLRSSPNAWNSQVHWLNEDNTACDVYYAHFESGYIGNDTWRNDKHVALCACKQVANCTQYNTDNCECSACETGFTTNSSGTACVCDAANHFVASGNTCVCDSVNGYTSNGSGGCTCNTENHYVASGNTCVCETGYTSDGNGACVKVCVPVNGQCSVNEDCCDGDFCAFEKPSSASNPGNGACRHLDDFAERATGNPKMANGNKFLRSSSNMSWWTVENWCLAKNMVRAGRDTIGCQNYGEYDICSSDTTDELRSGTNPWTDKDKTWLSETSPNGSQSYVWYPYLNSILVEDKNKNSNYYKRFAICSCPPVVGCGTYNTNCVCTGCKLGFTMSNGACVCDTANGFVSNGSGECVCTSGRIEVGGICRKICSNNSPCAANEFCFFPNATYDGGAGTGACMPSSIYGTASQTINGRKWVRSTTSESMDWWTAENWCKSQKANDGVTSLQMASMADLGCDEFNPGKYCTDTGSSGFPGKTGSALAALQSGGWTSGYHWVSNSGRNLIVFENGMIGDFDKDYSSIALCTCPTIEHCTEYCEEGCYCASCESGYKVNSSGKCSPCSSGPCDNDLYCIL
ncbi:MAG: hypothetical protein J6Y03_04635 [Alphaproteobacteria bacterium]|nr:hypothetical protein [Alphaproteobacteria bacterium]